MQSPTRWLALAAAALVVGRIVSSTSRRMASALATNRRSKAQLMADWKVRTQQERERGREGRVGRGQCCEVLWAEVQQGIRLQLTGS